MMAFQLRKESICCGRIAKFFIFVEKGLAPEGDKTPAALACGVGNASSALARRGDSFSSTDLFNLLCSCIKSKPCMRYHPNTIHYLLS